MKILFIACYSPLINNSASIETLQYLNNLVSIGNEIDLLTVDFPKNSIYYDEDILKMLDKRVKLHKISGGKIFEKIMPKKCSNNNPQNVKPTNSLAKNILRKGKKIIAIPDMYLNWSRKASQYGIELMKKEKFDVIFSMHEPPSSHICAMKIKKEFKNVQWIAYWSDPWLKDSTRENISGVRRYIEEKYEKEIIALADKHIFVTEENRTDYIESYNIKRENTFIVTRGYSKELYDDIRTLEKPELLKEDKVNIVYAGEIFSKLRDINPFIQALNDLEKERVDIFEKLNILFFGNIDNDDMKNRLVEVSNVKVSPRIPYNTALSYMINADILLLFGNKNSKQIPAKIYDYFGCDGDILVILGDTKDPIINLVKDKEKCNLVDNKALDIKNSIIDIVESLEKGNVNPPLNDFEWANITEKLNNILKS